MYVSDMSKPSFLSFSVPAVEPVSRMLRWAESVLFARTPNRAQAVQEVLRLNIVSGPGQTPTAYGWHIDALLNVRLQPATEPLTGAPEPPPDEGEFPPPDKGIRARVYRVPRTRRHPTLRVLQGGLAGDAA